MFKGKIRFLYPSPYCGTGYYFFVRMFVTGKNNRDRPIVPFENMHRITFWVDLPMSVSPSVLPCIFVNKVQVAFMIRFGWNLAQFTCLAQGRTLLKLGKIGSDLDIASIYSFVRFNVNGPYISFDLHEIWHRVMN